MNVHFKVILTKHFFEHVFYVTWLKWFAYFVIKIKHEHVCKMPVDATAINQVILHEYEVAVSYQE